MTSETEKEKINTNKLTPWLFIATLVLIFFSGKIWQQIQNLEGQSLSMKLQTKAIIEEGRLPKATAEKIPAVTDMEDIKGDRNAKVKLIVYTDLECKFCAEFHEDIKQVLADYQGKVLLVYRYYPLADNENSKNLALAADCIRNLYDLDKYWSFVDKVFTDAKLKVKVDSVKIATYASIDGVDNGKLGQCMKDGQYTQKIENDQKGGEAAGVRGTPTAFIMNDKGETWYLPGAFPKEQLKALIDAAMK